MTDTLKMNAIDQVISQTKEAVKKHQARITDSVVESMAKVEAGERTKVLIEAVVKFNEARADLQKADKPDVVAYDGTGKEASATFSKGHYEKIKKMREQLEKLDKAIGKAIKEADYGPVRSIVGAN